jgi:WD40 repeat protein
MSLSVSKKFAYTGHQSAIYTLSDGFSEGTFLSGSGDRFIAAWNLTTGQQENFAAQLPAPVFSLLPLKEKKLLLAGTGAGSVHVIDVEKKEELRILQLHTAQVFDMVCSEKHDLLITSGGEGQITFSGLATFEFIKAGKLCDQKIRNLAIHPNGNIMAVACGDGTIRIFSLEVMKEIHAFPAHELSANCIAWHPEGIYLLSGGRDAFLKSWDAEKNYAPVVSIPAHNYAIYKIAFSPDGKLFATASRDKTVKLWNADETGFLLRINKENFNGHTFSVNTLLWTKEGLLSGSDDRVTMLWEASGF